MSFDAILFDFDGVLIESEAVGNRQIAAYLTSIGHPTTPADSFANFMGLSGAAFTDAIERWIGRSLPDDFHVARKAEDERVMRAGVDAVEGAVRFVLDLPPTLPKAIASSSSTAWIARHLDHIGLRAAFGDRLFSGKEHVVNGKPAPDIYLHAAAALGVEIARCVIIEDSPVGATGAVASGAHVVGFVGGTHCGPDHADKLRAIGVHDVATDFAEIARLIG
ncbi:HAD family phosphatase [Sphingomonas sp. RB3P16]|uniref:HAD family hydrolase n=1 Tax=Parasphingomonas frigoris TaxID=3096163 RepID=UPI002FC5E31C